MTQEATELLHKALALSEEERAEMASTLIGSLDTVQDADAVAAWQQEVARRMQEIQSGKAKLISWESVRARARAILDGKVSR